MVGNLIVLNFLLKVNSTTYIMTNSLGNDLILNFENSDEALKYFNEFSSSNKQTGYLVDSIDDIIRWCNSWGTPCLVKFEKLRDWIKTLK